MPDTRRKLSDNEIDDRLKAAAETLGTEDGETVAGDTVLKAARRALLGLSLGLIASGNKRDGL